VVEKGAGWVGKGNAVSTKGVKFEATALWVGPRVSVAAHSCPKCEGMNGAPGAWWCSCRLWWNKRQRTSAAEAGFVVSYYGIHSAALRTGSEAVPLQGQDCCSALQSNGEAED
jgi:hypothetical protein